MYRNSLDMEIFGRWPSPPFKPDFRRFLMESVLDIGLMVLVALLFGLRWR